MKFHTWDEHQHGRRLICINVWRQLQTSNLLDWRLTSIMGPPLYFCFPLPTPLLAKKIVMYRRRLFRRRWLTGKMSAILRLAVNFLSLWLLRLLEKIRRSLFYAHARRRFNHELKWEFIVGGKLQSLPDRLCWCFEIDFHYQEFF